MIKHYLHKNTIIEIILNLFIPNKTRLCNRQTSGTAILQMKNRELGSGAIIRYFVSVTSYTLANNPKRFVIT